MIATFLARITPPCKDITRLVSQSMDRRLPWLTRLSLRLHCWICQACARYRDQLKTVRQALRQSAAAGSQQNDEPPTLSPEAKARLTEAFRAKHE
jgi:hypothetical protein